MKTNLQSNYDLDYNFGRTSFSPPSTWYIALSTTAIDANGNGLTEPSSSTGYARVAVTNSKTSFSASVNGELYNTVEISFPESTAAQGTITHIALCDAQTGGNVRFYEALPSPRQVQANTTLMFAQQTLKITTE